MIEVIRPGSTVYADGKKVRVLAVNINMADHVEYQIGYWHGGEWKTAWQIEAELMGGDRDTIGFKSPPQK